MIENPYLYAFRATGFSGEGRNIEELLRLGESDIDVRRNLVREWAWGVPTEEVIREIASRGPVIEIGAGTGYWAWMLREAGAEVVALDSGATHDADVGRYSPVEHGGPEDVPRFPAARILLLVWPPYDTPMAADALRLFRGAHVAFVGETWGCTGDDAFHRALEDEWEVEDTLPVPQYPFIHDACFLYRRRPTHRSEEKL